MKVRVSYIPNILHVDGREERIVEVPVLASTSVREVLHQSRFDYQGRRIILDSRKIDDLKNTFAYHNSHIIIVPDIGGPVFALAQVAFGLAKFLFFSKIGLALQLLATTAYSVYQATQKPRVPNFNAGADGLDEGSPTYSWDGITTQQDAGIPIPIVYGEHRVGGNIINQFIYTDGDKNYLNVLLGVCEGEIESISEVKINENPIENFSGITTYQRMGTTDQAVIPNFEDLHSVVNLPETRLTQNNAYLYTTVDGQVEALELTFNMPSGLYQVADDGSTQAWQVNVTIEYKLTSSGTWISAGQLVISARSRSALRRIFRIEGLAAGKYDLRVTRTSADSSLDPARNGDLYFVSIDEIRTDDLAYPNMALLGIRALATDQLSGSTPNLTFLVKGRKVNIPKVMNGGVEIDWEDYYWNDDAGEYRLFSDDTPLTWDGSTYVDRYCANPAWCMKDLLTNDRYGLGDVFDSSSISPGDYLEMSRVCDQRIDDGDGGYEKLYRMDIVIDSQTRALDALVQLASTFDAFVFYSAGLVKFRVDVDEDPVQLFGMGNIVAGSLIQAWKSHSEVYNMVRVQFSDKTLDYRQETISVVDDEAIERGDQFKPRDLRIHTTKVSYALRAARRALKVAKLINRTISFKAGVDSLAIAPGDVIGLSHDVPQIGHSGRIIDGGPADQVWLDQKVPIESGKTYFLAVQFSDDTIEQRQVTSTEGNKSVLEVSPAFSQIPQGFDRYAFGQESILYKRFRVVSINLDDKWEAEISAIEIDPNVYDYSAPIIPQDKFSLLSTEIQDVQDLQISEMVIKARDGSIINTIEVWWTPPADTSYYLNAWSRAQVWISEDAGVAWRKMGESSGDHFIIDDNIVTGKTYHIAVASVSRNGMKNAIADSPQGSITILGKQAPPSKVQNFEVYQQGAYLIFQWDPVPDGDLARYVVKRGTDWVVGDFIGEKVDVTKFEYPVGTIGPQTFMIKAIDTSGNESTDVAFDEINVTPPPENNFVLDIDPWAQNREYKLTNIQRVQRNLFSRFYARDVFALATTKTFESIEAGGKGWDQLEEDGDLDAEGVVESSGTIEQIDPIDLETIFEFNVLASFLYKNVSGGSLSLEIAYSEDNVTWNAFETVTASARYRARYIRFRYTLSTADTDHNVYFYAGTLTINAPEIKVDFGRDLAVAIGGSHIVFRNDFTLPPRVTGLNIVNGIKGRPFADNVDEDGMDVYVVDKDDSLIGTAEVDWEVKGS